MDQTPPTPPEMPEANASVAADADAVLRARHGVESGHAIGPEALDLIAALQAELDTLRQQLAWSNRLSQLGMLTASLAHETNNFLTPIRTYAQLALRKPDDPALAERALQIAIDNTGKAGRLNQRVMELASPNQSIQTTVCNLKAACDSAAAAMTPILKQHRVDFISDVASVEVQIDALSLEQVLINLITNACQAMAETVRQRRINMSSKAQQGGCIHLQLQDTGPGVPTELRDRLFDAFTTSKHASGSDALSGGLGLSICQQLIESAGGEIGLAESGERGSIFEVRLRITCTDESGAK